MFLYCGERAAPDVSYGASLSEHSPEGCRLCRLGAAGCPGLWCRAGYEERQGRDCLFSNLRDGKKTGGRNLKGAVNSREILHARKCCEVGEMNF